jgi:LysM repeat protein
MEPVELMPVHTVKQGDTISSIAEQYGFAKWETIWNHGNNGEIKGLRKNPHILFPGDSVFVPDKAVRADSAPTTRLNLFQVKLGKLDLNLQVKDLNDRPVSNATVVLEVEGAIVPPHKTDGDGKTSSRIKRSAKKGAFVLKGKVEAELRIGALDPVEKQSGQVARLNNLGYGAGDPESPDPESFRSAVEEFQCDNGIKVTGVCDGATQSKLESVHGC